MKFLALLSSLPQYLWQYYLEFLFVMATVGSLFATNKSLVFVRYNF